jgi:hypothetical protein
MNSNSEKNTGMDIATCVGSTETKRIKILQVIKILLSTGGLPTNGNILSTDKKPIKQK